MHEGDAGEPVSDPRYFHPLLHYCIQTGGREEQEQGIVMGVTKYLPMENTEINYSLLT